MNIDATKAATTSQLSTKIAQTEELLGKALTEFGQGQIALSFSGAEDVVLIDLVQSLGRAAGCRVLGSRVCTAKLLQKTRALMD